MTGLIRSRAFEPLQLWKEFDNWDNLFGTTKIRIPIDVAETEREYRIKADTPGFDKDEISISLEDNILTIQGTKKNENKEENENYIRRERFYSNFQKSITLYDDADVNNIDASMENGTLQLIIPKKTQPKKTITKIDIK